MTNPKNIAELAREILRLIDDASPHAPMSSSRLAAIKDGVSMLAAQVAAEQAEAPTTPKAAPEALTDEVRLNSDAFELAAKLKLGISYEVDRKTREEVVVVSSSHVDEQGYNAEVQPCGTDALSATRRAIVLIAADIGKLKG